VSDKRPFDDRREQTDAITQKLDVYQRRYPGLDAAYEYRIWYLDVLKNGTTMIDYERGFMQWMERSQRWANEAKGKLSLDEALAYAPKLTNGFKRLVAAFRQDNYISVETVQVYAQEFEDLSEEEFSEMCQRAIRSLDRFPTVAALIRLRAEAADDASVAKADEERRQEYEERRRMNIRMALIEEKIKALPEEEQAALQAEAIAKLGLTANTQQEFKDLLLGKCMLALFEDRYGPVTA
jgi:hypothetical protein